MLPHIYIFSSYKGGPLVNWIPTKDRFYLIGIVSGSFFDCSNKLPGIFVQVDEISVLNFLRKEIFGDDPIQLGIRGLLYLEGWELFFYLFFFIDSLNSPPKITINVRTATSTKSAPTTISTSNLPGTLPFNLNPDL